MEHLIRKGARYYYRRRVPKALIAALEGKTEITRALNTSDPSEARVRCRKVDVEVDELFAQASSGAPLAAAPVSTRSKDGLGSEAYENYLRERDEYEEGAALALHETLEEQEASWIKIEARQAKDARRKEMVREVMTEIFAKVIGTGARIEHPASLPNAASAKPTGGPTLVEALAVWERRRAPSKASINMMERVIDLARRSGVPLVLSAITKQHVTTFLESMNELSRATQRSYLSLLKALFSACVSEDFIATNPASLVKLDAARQRSVKARVPFSTADLNVIVSSLRSDNPKPSNYWLPFVSLFTGMRMMEIGQLRANDIKIEHYTDSAGKRHSAPFIYATDEGDEQSLKSLSSKRRIPVHPELVRLGFVKYARSVSGQNRLFPELTMDRYGRITARYSQVFSKHLREVCKITDPRKTFHSFRHGFKNALRECGVSEQVSDALTGHTSGSVARSYGDDYYPLRPLVEAVDQVAYHGLILPK
ncbi:integrase [Paraburkholderia sp. GAS199]|uniref:DUF6538 domain-containing protein n=1 Tax=Paraburkholderia sp. GAS199 TaxID=3035126 RepID=UPI003D229538